MHVCVLCKCKITFAVSHSSFLQGVGKMRPVRLGASHAVKVGIIVKDRIRDTVTVMIASGVWFGLVMVRVNNTIMRKNHWTHVSYV